MIKNATVKEVEWMNRQFFTISDYVDSSKHVSVAEKTIAGRTDMHVHEFFEIEIVVSGGGKHYINEVEHEITAGSVYLITPGTFHKLVCLPQLELITIMFDETVLSMLLIPELINRTSNFSLLMSGEELAEMNTLARLLIKSLESHDEYTNLFIGNLLNCMIVKIIRESDRAGVGDGHEKNATLNNVVRYLYKNFGENPSLKKIALMSGYSPNYFSKIFSEFAGKGYTEFLNDLKVAHAKVLLSSDEKTVSEIAFYCGFSSLSNFYRVFREATGVAPLDYRKNLGV